MGGRIVRIGTLPEGDQPDVFDATSGFESWMILQIIPLATISGWR